MKIFKQETSNFSHPNEENFYLYLIENEGVLHTVRHTESKDGGLFSLETVGSDSSSLEVVPEQKLRRLFLSCDDYHSCKIYEFKSMSDLILFCLKNKEKIKTK